MLLSASTVYKECSAAPGAMLLSNKADRIERGCREVAKTEPSNKRVKEVSAP